MNKIILLGFLILNLHIILENILIVQCLFYESNYLYHFYLLTFSVKMGRRLYLLSFTKTCQPHFNDISTTHAQELNNF